MMCLDDDCPENYGNPDDYDNCYDASGAWYAEHDYPPVRRGGRR